MVREVQYTNIRRVLDNLLDHPLLRDVNLEQAVRYVLRFISLHGYPKLYEDKIEDVDIKDFRGTLPCDLISIIQVKDLGSGICLRSMTDNFTPGLVPHDKRHHHHPPRFGMYIPPTYSSCREPAFKTQGRIIFTSFPKGKVGVAYKAIQVDEDGYPLLIDNEVYLAALEAYIKKQVFTIKFDTGKIQAGVLQNAQRDYALLAGELRNEFSIPSVSEMESITRMINTLIPRMREFDNGFVDLGNREYLVNHRGGNTVRRRLPLKDMGIKPGELGPEDINLPPLKAITKDDVDEVTNTHAE